MNLQKKFFKNRHSNFKPKMYQGHWKCADCGREITKLPFNPKPQRAVYCKECWLKRKNKSEDIKE